ncbi:MAG: BACON domain-containing protein [Alistipes sp.]|nr:BACON domain-containing protein [Alistipes sp.]
MLRFSTNGVVFNAEGGEKSVKVITYPKDVAWDLYKSGENEWFTATNEEGVITVTAQPNISGKERRGEFEVVSPNRSFELYTLTVLQEAIDKFTTSTNAAESYSFDSEGGEYSFSVFTNAEWSLSTDAEWITLSQDVAACKATISAAANTSKQTLTGSVVLTIGVGSQAQTFNIVIAQATRDENPYYKLCGQWEISASKWYYSPNGSLNSLDYAPSPSQYYLIFNIEEGIYGESLVMRDFLYPGTSLEVRYDKQSGGFVIPFGWSVLSYDVFFYITMVSSSQFSYASLDVDVVPSSDYMVLTPKLPTVSGFNYVGFGLWTYNDNGAKVAFGSSSRPTMFPMGTITFRKH